ncbi:MAG TPA: hemerythrin domain-containing protein [Rubrivivax sp.]|nr:hemerythrin domain-containing protein [Rubrivivax sp.]
MMTLFELLRQSHDIQRNLCRQVTATRSDVARRELLFLQLKIELEAHAAAEERFLYVPILLTDAGLSVSRHALAEHHDIEEYCEDLSVRDKSGDAWLDTAKKLSAKVRHHLKEEEKKFFQVAGRILSDPQKVLLARRYEKDVIRMRRKLAADYQKVDVSPSGRLQPAV